VIGIEIGSANLRAARLLRRGRAWHAQWSPEIPIERGPSPSDETAWPELGRALDALPEEFRSGRERIAVSLPPPLYTVRVLSFPFRSARKIRRAAPFVIEQVIPGRIEDVTFALVPLRDHGSSGPKRDGRPDEQRVLAALCRKRILRKVLAEFQSRKIDPEIVHPDLMATAVLAAQAERGAIGNPTSQHGQDRAAEATAAARDDRTPGGLRVLVDLDRAAARFIVLKDGALRFARVIRRPGSPLTHAPNRGPASDVLARNIDAILRGEGLDGETGAGEWLCDGDADEEDVVARAALGSVCATSRPLRPGPLAPGAGSVGAVLAQVADGHGPLRPLGSALALAEDEVGLNLRVGEFQCEGERRLVRRQLTAAGLLMAVVLGLLAGHQTRRYFEVRTRIREVRARQETVFRGVCPQPRLKPSALVMKRVSQDIVRDRKRQAEQTPSLRSVLPYWVELSLIQRVAGHVDFESLDFDQKGAKLTALAQDLASKNRFQAAVEQSRKLRGGVTTIRQHQQQYVFEMRLQYKE